MGNVDPREGNLTRASTVILYRSGNPGIEVFLLKRSGKSRFMPGMYVFPGGKVASEDTDIDSFGDCLDIDVDKQTPSGDDYPIEHGIAAIRETFEEAGVLLAGTKSNHERGMERACELRLNGRLERNWLLQLVLNGPWILSLSALFPWSHWITPELMPIRFDTRFFLALMPPEQVCCPDNRETTDGKWVSPLKGLEENLEGKTPLSPPTIVTLWQLSAYRDISDLQQDLKKGTWGDPLRPRMIDLAQGGVILEPWDPMIDRDFQTVPDSLIGKVVAPGEEFSRLWYHEGRWLPVSAQ